MGSNALHVRYVLDFLRSRLHFLRVTVWAEALTIALSVCDLIQGERASELLGSVGITSLDLGHRSPFPTQPKSRFAQQDLLHKDMG